MALKTSISFSHLDLRTKDIDIVNPRIVTSVCGKCVCKIRGIEENCRSSSV